MQRLVFFDQIGIEPCRGCCKGGDAIDDLRFIAVCRDQLVHIHIGRVHRNVS